MEIGRMAEILEAEVICGQENLNKEISLAVASDMMSDVLVSAESDRVLISGLCTIHTVLTAQILDLSAGGVCAQQGAYRGNGADSQGKRYRTAAHRDDHVCGLWRAIQIRTERTAQGRCIAPEKKPIRRPARWNRATLPLPARFPHPLKIP